MLEARDVVEVLRGLHHRDLRIGEVAERRPKEFRCGHVIGVEHPDDVRIHDAERMVQVPRLGMLVRRAGEVPRPE
jgi:hypothetical protein